MSVIRLSLLLSDGSEVMCDARPVLLLLALLLLGHVRLRAAWTPDAEGHTADVTVMRAAVVAVTRMEDR